MLQSPSPSFRPLREGSLSKEPGPTGWLVWLRPQRPHSEPDAQCSSKGKAAAAPRGSPLTSNASRSGQPGSWRLLTPRRCHQALHPVHALSAPSCGSRACWLPLCLRTLLSRPLVASVQLSPCRACLPLSPLVRALTAAGHSVIRSPPLPLQCRLIEGRALSVLSTAVSPGTGQP